MKVWLPYVTAGSGVDVYTALLARGLRELDCDVVCTPVPHKWQYFPWGLRRLPMPTGTDVILTNSWNGFAFARQTAKLAVVEHHCIFDSDYLAYRSAAQAVFHETMVRRFEMASFRSANAVISVSNYTARSLHRSLNVNSTKVIHNGVDTQFFCPSSFEPNKGQNTPFRLLFVGNPSRRKGADLLLPIMRSLGKGYELRYTSGLRDEELGDGDLNLRRLGRLGNLELREEYRNADLLLFPSRLEGFGYAAAEAMACGTPVVASDRSSLPEIVKHGQTGLLCSPTNPEAFAQAIRSLRDDPQLLNEMAANARSSIETHFPLNRMATAYVTLFKQLMT